jgi:hypothetical protein
LSEIRYWVGSPDEEPAWLEALGVANRLVAAWGLSEQIEVVGPQISEAVRWTDQDIRNLGRLLYCLSAMSNIAMTELANKLNGDLRDVQDMIEKALVQVVFSPQRIEDESADG